MRPELGDILEQVPAAVCALDGGELVYANGEFGRLFARAPSSLGGVSPLELVHADDRAGVARALEGLGEASGEECRHAFRGTGRGGEAFWCEARCTPLEAGGAAVVVCVVVEREPGSAAVGRQAGRIAHELNNVLSTVMGHAELARGELEDGSQAAADLEAIELAVDRASLLTARLRAFSRRLVESVEAVEAVEAGDGA